MHYCMFVISDNASEVDELMAPYNEDDFSGDYEQEEDIEDDREPGKWDFYQIGGRWARRLLTHSGNWCDQCHRRSLDLDGMRAQEEEYAAAVFDLFAPAFEGHDIPGAPGCRDPDSKAVERYKAHPVIAAILNTWKWAWELRSHERMPGMGEDFRTYFHNGDREAFLAEARLNALSAAALLDEDGWHEEEDGRIFGQKSAEFLRQVNEAIEHADEAKVITVVDCHT